MDPTPHEINILLAKMQEMQSKLNELETLKRDVKEIKELSSVGEDIAKEVAEEVKQLQENGISIPHLEKQAAPYLYPRREYKGRYTKPLLEAEILEALNSTPSARQAAKKLGVHYDTYKKYARLYGIHRTCPVEMRKKTGKTGPITPFGGKYKIEDLLNGKHPKFPVHRLKDKLIRSGMKKSECEICGYKERRITDGKIPLLLNFDDGDINNRTIDNLKVYCFNCTFNCGRGFIKRGTVHYNMDPDVMQGAKRPIKARH